LEGIESQWQKDLKSRDIFIRFLADHIYEVVFLSGAILTLAGFCRFLYRKRKAFLDEEQDELFNGQ
ncbi:MAG: hypothetical protein D6778_02175, partial [Nitrospirae bacterium]